MRDSGLPQLGGASRQCREAGAMRGGWGKAARLGLLIWLLLSPPAAVAAPKVYLLDFSGAVGPVSADYLVRGLRQAANEDATIVVLQMDTPGGLDTSMREIIRAILSSPVPVVGYVSPSGARAASAGTYILYARHQRRPTTLPLVVSRGSMASRWRVIFPAGDWLIAVPTHKL